MAWSWVGEYSCFVTFAHELVGSVGFPVSSLCWVLFDDMVVCTHAHIRQEHTVHVYISCTAVLGLPTQLTVVYLAFLTL